MVPLQVTRGGSSLPADDDIGVVRLAFDTLEDFESKPVQVNDLRPGFAVRQVQALAIEVYVFPLESKDY